MQIALNRSGLTVKVAGQSLSVRAVYLIDGQVSQHLALVTPEIRADAVTYPRRGLTEWYRNERLGLQDGFTIDTPLHLEASPLTVVLALTGSLTAQRTADGVAFLAKDRQVELTYTSLSATDSTGRPLPASIELAPHELRIRVTAESAALPIRIDPLIKPAPAVEREVKITPQDAIGVRDFFGGPGVVSGDGDVALVGGAGDDHDRGAAWVFVRVGSRWVQEAKLVPRGEIGAGAFGSALALSASGRVALIGAADDDHDRGAAWVFTRTRSGWRQASPKLTGGGEAGGASFGYSVALSGNGREALVGAPDDRPIPVKGGLAGHGAMWAFQQTRAGWVQQGTKIIPRDPGIDFGLYIALASDGKTALIGSYESGFGGGAWVFVQSHSGWAQQGPELFPHDAIGRSGFGDDVALSASGNTALIGGGTDDRDDGAAWVFSRSGNRWIQEAKLVPRGSIGPSGFGIDVALSGTGDTALIGAWLDNNQRGAAWLYKRTATGWKQLTPPLTGTHELGHPVWFGSYVALSSDASTALIGGEDDDHDRGAAWAIQLQR